MTALLASPPPAVQAPQPAIIARRPNRRATAGRWTRFVAALAITVIALLPIAAIVRLSLEPPAESGLSGIGFDSYVAVLTNGKTLLWLWNSIFVALASTAATILVAAPAGYVLSRAKSKFVGGYSFLLFVVQSLPIVVFVIPLVIVFTGFGLADNLLGVIIVHVATSLSVACWMMSSYFDSIPTSLEEAAWMDGCSIFGSFVRIVLRNSGPGVLSTAIFAFIAAWNDYLVSVVFLRSTSNFTLPIGLQTFFQQDAGDWGQVMAMAVIMMLPPILVFALLNRYFSVGGIGGSLAGQ